MQNLESSDPGYPTTLLTPTSITTVQPIRLVHINPEAHGTEGFDNNIMSLTPEAMTVEGKPAYYRYTLAVVKPTERIRVVGLVAGLVKPDLYPPLWIAVDSNDLDAVLTTQGEYLGNLADSKSVVHRLERYTGAALESMLADMLSNRPALTILERPDHEAANIIPVFITSLAAASTCLRQRTTGDEHNETTERAWRWLMTVIAEGSHTSSSSVDYGQIPTHQQDSTTLLGGQVDSPLPSEQPATVTWKPDLALLRQLANTNDPTLHIPAALAISPATSVINRVADPLDEPT